MSCKDDQQVSWSRAKNFPEVRRKLRRSLSESSIVGEGQASPASRRLNTSGGIDSNNNNNNDDENRNQPETANLYSKVRQQLRKVHRISKTGLSAPKTPSKPGVYVETHVDKFAQIKSLFDRRCRGGTSGPSGRQNSIAAGARDRVRIANSFVRKLASSINSSTTKPRRLYNADFESSPDRVTFNTRKGIVKLESSISESPARQVK